MFTSCCAWCGSSDDVCVGLIPATVDVTTFVGTACLLGYHDGVRLIHASVTCRSHVNGHMRMLTHVHIQTPTSPPALDAHRGWAVVTGNLQTVHQSGQCTSTHTSTPHGKARRGARRMCMCRCMCMCMSMCMCMFRTHHPSTSPSACTPSRELAAPSCQAGDLIGVQLNSDTHSVSFYHVSRAAMQVDVHVCLWMGVCSCFFGVHVLVLVLVRVSERSSCG